MKRLLTYNVLFWAAAYSGLLSLNLYVDTFEPLGPSVAQAQPQDPALESELNARQRNQVTVQSAKDDMVTEAEVGVNSVPGRPAAEGPVAVPPGTDAMMADSPFTDYAARAALFVLVAGFLVVIMIGGSLLVMNLGLMSKRPRDHVGRRTPSDLGLLKGTMYPEEPYQERTLPAREEGDHPGISDDEHIRVGSVDDQSITSQGIPVSRMRSAQQAARLEREREKGYGRAA